MKPVPFAEAEKARAALLKGLDMGREVVRLREALKVAREGLGSIIRGTELADDFTSLFALKHLAQELRIIARDTLGKMEAE